MFYDFSLPIAANTSHSAVTEEKVELTHGVITHVEVEFPPGCAGLVYAYIKWGVHQIWPTNPGGKFRGDGRAIIWNEYYELFDIPYMLEIAGWNEDDTFDHDITFRFEITPKEIAERGKVTGSIVSGIKSMLRL